MYNFEKLIVYQKVLDFVELVYLESSKWDRAHLYSLTDQFRRAALSIALNIAEGTSRSKKDFNHFLSIAVGSCFECLACLDIAFRLKLINLEEKNHFRTELESITRMLSGLRNSLKEKLITKNK